jgi:hypothetical protein
MSIDIMRLQAPANFAQLYGSSPQMRNPRGDEDIRVHPTWCVPQIPMTRVSTNTFYVVGAGLFEAFIGRMMVCTLRAAMSGNSTPFVWVVPDGRTSVKEAVEKATVGWTRIAWDTATRAYRVEAPAAQHAEPVWPFASFDNLLDLALKDRILEKADDPVVQAILAKKRKPTRQQA